MAFILKPRFYCRKLDIMVSMCRLTDCDCYNQCHTVPVQNQVAIFANVQNVEQESVAQSTLQEFL